MISTTIRLVFPAAVLAYAAYGIAGALPALDRTTQDHRWTLADWMQGRASATINDTWRAALPHHDFAAGVVGAGRWLALKEGRKGVVSGRNGWLFTQEEARKMDEPMEAVFARTEILRETLADKGIDLVVVPLAGKADIYRNELGGSGMARDLEERYATFFAGLQAMGIKVVDSRSALLDAARHAQVFYSSDTHWTRAGAAAVAEAVAQVVPQGSASVSAQEEPAQQFHGDLTKFITSAEWTQRVGLPEETARPFVTQVAENGDDLFDTLLGPASVETVLVGTSYSANPNWSFAESLKLDLHQDVLNYAKEGQGPVKPFLEMLADQAFQLSPPKQVIWEVPVRYLADPDIWTAPENLQDAPLLAGQRAAMVLAHIGADQSPVRSADLALTYPARFADLGAGPDLPKGPIFNDK
ncbi:hypothetical protein [Thioclava sp. GXIMD4216]|uniref:alginate O-acetyltransferase AlgX-related protein n=1 Tax=Thioclava sp. GXIMD4216 TaxID=3131929 RepID=UPI0030D2EAD9